MASNSRAAYFPVGNLHYNHCAFGRLRAFQLACLFWMPAMIIIAAAWLVEINQQGFWTFIAAFSKQPGVYWDCFLAAWVGLACVSWEVFHTAVFFLHLPTI